MTPKAAFGWRHDQEAATSASIFPMGERQGDNREPVHPNQRVFSDDYGKGTVQGISPPWAHVLWDKPFLPGSSRLVVHDVSFVERLEKLPPEKQGSDGA